MVSDDDSAYAWADLPRAIARALSTDGLLPAAHVLTNMFCDDSDMDTFLESQGLVPGSVGWLRAKAILLNEVSSAAARAGSAHKRRALMGMVHCKPQGASCASPSQGWGFTRSWLFNKSGAKCLMRRWPSRLARKMALAANPQARAEAEDVELRRWRDVLVAVLRTCNMPIAKQADFLEDPVGALRLVASNTRAATLRRRLKEWEKFSLWCRVYEGSPFPSSVACICAYLEDLRRQPCARTRLKAVFESLRFIERVGGVRQMQWLSLDRFVISMVDVYTAELEASAPPTKHAVPFPLLMVMSLELALRDEGLELFFRAFAWTRLLKLWTSSRADDIQGVNPENIRFSTRGLEGLFDRTKTSGPGRRVRWLPFFVSRQAFVVDREWLQLGWGLWKSAGFDFQRDFLVPRPSADFSSCVRVPASYSEMSRLSKQLFMRLHMPVHDGHSWALGSEPLFSDKRIAFAFTEHSERCFMMTLSAWAGVDRERRAYLGRWHVVEASDEYIRSAWRMVTSLQVLVVRELCKAPDLQAIGLDDLEARLKEQGWEDSQAKRVVTRLAVPSKWAQQRASELSPDSQNAAANVCEAASEQIVPISAKYFVAILGKKKLRRLHRMQGCGTDPTSLHAVEFHESLEGGVSFDVECKHCFREAGEIASAASDSTEGSSSSASSDSGTET
mgnify:CR=1 FL=1